MQRNLRDESADLIKLVTGKIIDFQGNEQLARLQNQLRRAAIRRDEANGNVVLFDLETADRQFDASSPLDVEARATDTFGNPLHAVVYLDKSRDLLALEVFSWDQWTGGIAAASLTPARYDDQGLSNGPGRAPPPPPRHD